MDVRAEPGAGPEAFEAVMDAATDATEAELARADADAPRRQLSVDLMRTFMRINANYYRKRGLGPDGAALPAGKRALVKAGAAKEQAAVEHYSFAVNGEELFHNGRYRSSGKRMGMGAFGVVAEAVDTLTGRKVAIKVVKAQKRFTEHAQMEIQLLKMLQETGNPATKHIVQLLDSFMHGEHQCLVFELLGPNLYDVLRASKLQGLSFKVVRKFSKQILTVLEFLKHPRIDVIHCDLKPENILLVQHGHSQLKLIDFGSSCFKHKQMFKYIQSRFYRAPEVLLGLPYTTAIDMWSLGCILVELHTGKPLFPGYDKHDQMTRIINVLGMVPDDLIRKANVHYRNSYFDEFSVTQGGKRWTEYRVKVHKAPPAKASTVYPTGPTSLAEILRTSAKYDLDGMHADDQYDLFQDFVAQMLHYDPEQRITPTQALQHPFMEAARRMSPEFERKTKKVKYSKVEDILQERGQQQRNSFGLDKRPRQGD